MNKRIVLKKWQLFDEQRNCHDSISFFAIKKEHIIRIQKLSNIYFMFFKSTSNEEGIENIVTTCLQSSEKLKKVSN